MIKEGKECTKCFKLKPLEGFNRRKTSVDGHRPDCRECQRLNNKRYHKTFEGLLTQIYRHQRGASKQRGHPLPPYTKEELKEWLLAQPSFKELYSNWVASDYNKMLTPSIDRLDDNIGYLLDNIQLTTWSFNVTKSHKDRRTGKLITSQNTAVNQYHRDGRFIASYISQGLASRETGVSRSNIGATCRGKVKSAGGYFWRYKKEDDEVAELLNKLKEENGI